MIFNAEDACDLVYLGQAVISYFSRPSEPLNSPPYAHLNHISFLPINTYYFPRAIITCTT